MQQHGWLSQYQWRYVKFKNRLIYDVRSQSELWLLLGNREGFVIGKECERGFWSAGKGLFLDQGNGFMDMLTL